MAPTDVAPTDAARVVVVMGVAGSGKTAVGTRVAEVIGAAFADADDDHPPANRAKMASGTPLDDADRAPWLERLRQRIAHHLTTGETLVLACSALKVAYRDALAAGDPRVRFLFLDAPEDVLRERLDERSDHFFPGDLLASQRAALEPPELATRIDAAAPLATVVAEALRALDMQGEAMEDG